METNAIVLKPQFDTKKGIAGLTLPKNRYKPSLTNIRLWIALCEEASPNDWPKKNSRKGIGRAHWAVFHFNSADFSCPFSCLYLQVSSVTMEGNSFDSPAISSVSEHSGAGEKENLSEDEEGPSQSAEEKSLSEVDLRCSETLDPPTEDELQKVSISNC